MDALKTFDAVIGHDTLKELKAVLDIPSEKLIIPNGNKKFYIPLLQHKFSELNNIEIRTDHLDDKLKLQLTTFLKNYKDMFQPPDSKLTYTTNIKAKIRTIDNEPIYSKSYPYPQSYREEVTKQISKLLKDGIIRKSKSPYNSPIWIVPKKMDASGEKKFRLVIDYRKLNNKTISDRYPIPDTSQVLANLGENKYFTTLDLASGFHQIAMAEDDIEKTAFSINNGKYEFVRMPFGLKNAPAIFQRTMDDVLKEYIGKICYVYIDDIIIFGKTTEEHFKNLQTILETLRNANFKIQPDKSEFFKEEVEFLGFIVSKNGLKPNIKKVEAIKKYPEPDNLKALRSFLGLSGYYRRFIKDYAKIAKPLTKLLRGEDGHSQIGKNQSKNHTITFDEKAKKAFNTLKDILSSKDVLAFPDFTKPFILTTDASNVAIGAVLSQKFPEGEKPITFISRTLTKAEENYATNEKEMLAIIWALDSLRNYVYGAEILIYTDHMPLTFAMSPKNNNNKMKKWMAHLDEHNHQIFYKPGRTNLVADALSRVQINNMINSMTPTQHSAEDDDRHYIPSTESPVNVFKNQLIFQINRTSEYSIEHPFPQYTRHIFKEPGFSIDFLTDKLKRFLRPNVLNGIYTSEPIMATIQEIYRNHFNPAVTKARFSQNLVRDITDENEQLEEVKKVHKFAHRYAGENVQQLLKICYFPAMNKIVCNFIKNCEICNTEKYNRHPQKLIPIRTPVPTYPGEIIHIDIFAYHQDALFLTSLDKFSKFMKVRPIKSRSIVDIKDTLMQLLYDWDVPKQIVIDNESSFISNVIEQMINNLGILIYRTPVHHSETNGQVERSHSTIRELARCLLKEDPDLDTYNLIQTAVYKYNNSFHSFVKNTPHNIYIGERRELTLDELQRLRDQTHEKVLTIFRNKDASINQDKQYPTYEPNTTAYERTKEISKRRSRNKPIVIKENHDTYIIDSNNRKVHKMDINPNR